MVLLNQSFLFGMLNWVQIFIKFTYTFAFSGRTGLPDIRVIFGQIIIILFKRILITTHIKNKQYTIQSVDFKRLVFYLFLPLMHSFFTQKRKFIKNNDTNYTFTPPPPIPLHPHPCVGLLPAMYTDLTPV